MERKKRSKGRGWESCYVKKIYGTFGVEMRAYGQKLVKFCTHTHTGASPIVVTMYSVCIYIVRRCCYCDVSVLSMLVIGFLLKKKFGWGWMGWVRSIQVYFGFFRICLTL